MADLKGGGSIYAKIGKICPGLISIRSKVSERCTVAKTFSVGSHDMDPK